MSFMIVGGGIALAFFVLSYFRAGRFGAAALAVGAGYLLTLLWGEVIAAYNLVGLPFLTWRELVYFGMILLPGLLAILFSHKQKSVLPRMIAAIAATLLVIAALLPLLNSEPQTQIIYSLLDQNREVIIGAVLTLGIVDVAFARLPKPPKPSKH